MKCEIVLEGVDHARRAPHGARGLKLLHGVKEAIRKMSRPAWGAWIEIAIRKRGLPIA